MPELKKLQEQLEDAMNVVAQKERELKELRSEMEEIKTQIYAVEENAEREAARRDGISVEEAKNTVLTPGKNNLNDTVNVEITNGTPE